MRLRDALKPRLVGLASFALFELRLFRLWQLAPRRLRRRIVGRLVRLPSLPDGPRPAEAVAPHWVLGFFSSHTSLGWVARSTLRSFEERGLFPVPVDIADRFGTRHVRQPSEERTLSPGPGTLVLCVNPNQIALALSPFPRELVAGKYLVGVFVWELERIPPDWKAPLALMDEIRVPTRFVADAFAAAGFEGPIRLDPYRIEPPADVKRDRARFGLPEGRFLVLASANLRSGSARKNLAGCVRAFALAFPPEEAATLVLKLHDGHLAPAERQDIRAAASAVDAVIVEDDLDEPAMWTLIESCDAVLSMHRAEGYGLLLKQGLLLDKPVVATGWSGNLDFMANEPNAHLVDYELIPVEDPQEIYDAGDATLRWAEPDPGSAAGRLRAVYDAFVARAAK